MDAPKSENAGGFLERAILGSKEQANLDRMVQLIVEEEDRCFLKLADEMLERMRDRKLRKQNYRAWKAKHSKLEIH